MQVPRKRLFYLGLIVIASSVVFSIVTYYFPGYPIMGDVYTVINLGEGRQEVIIVVSPRNNETRWEGYVYLRAPYPDYPLRQYHALSYVFLAIGLVPSFYSLRIKWNISPKLELTKHIIMGKKLWIVLLIGLVIGLGIGYLIIPKQEKTVTLRVLNKWEVSRVIMEDNCEWPFLETKPETIEFLSFELVNKGANRWVWVVEYECDARGTGIVGLAINDSEVVPIEPKFGRMFFKLEVNAYTGQMRSGEARSLELPPLSPLYRSVSVMEFRDGGKTLGNLISTLAIFNLSKDTVSIALIVRFISSDETLLEGVGLRVGLFAGIFGESILRAFIPALPIEEFSLRSYGRKVLAYQTYDITAFDTPIVGIGYSIYAIELRFANRSTALIEKFYQGNCKVTPRATLSMTNHVMWGIAPLWEGDYKYPPSLVLHRLVEVEGQDLWRKIVINTVDGSYATTKKEPIGQGD